MKNTYILIFFFLSAALIWSCAEEDADLSAPTVPGVVDMGISIAPDSSGVVTFTPKAKRAMNFHLYPGDGNGPILITPGDSYEHTYGGVDSVEFAASIVAYGVGAGSSSGSELIEMFLKLQIEPETMIALAGAETSSTKRWVWDSSAGGLSGHFGVGPGPEFNNACCPFDGTPSFFAAGANQFDGGCLYDDVLVFSVDASGNPSFTLETNGVTFVNGGQLEVFGVANGDDTCLAIDDDLVLSGNWGVRSVEGGMDILTTGTGASTPLSYYVPVNEFNIMELSENKLRVQGITTDGILAWYFQFIPE